MGQPLKLRIVVESPPAGVDYALQKGKGSAWEPDQAQVSDGGDVTFEFEPVLRGSELSGPYVQGPKGGRFVYVGIGTCAGNAASCWSRRMKVPLADITSNMVAMGGVLEARVP